MSAALPVLSAENGLSRYLAEIRRFPMLQPEEEYMLAKRWREHGDRDAAQKLVTSHLRLVAKIAMGYRGYGLPIGEVISEGNVGLMQAVKRFEPEKGFRLATYAMWWISASIQEYILRSWSLVKMGTTANQKKLFFNLRKAKSQISALEEGDLRPDQVKIIATRLGVSEQEVIDMNRRLSGDASLNAPIRQEGEGEWQDWLVDDSTSQETVLVQQEETEQPHGRAETGAGRAQRARTAHLRGAQAVGRSGDPRGIVDRVRHFARARAADRGARLREGAGGREGRPRRRSRRRPMRRPPCRRTDDRRLAKEKSRPKGRLYFCVTRGAGSALPLLDRLVEQAVARRALLDRDLRDAPVRKPDRNVEPAARLHRLEVARRKVPGRR